MPCRPWFLLFVLAAITGLAVVETPVFADELPAADAGPQRKLHIEHHWLHFPVKQGEPKRRVRVTVGGQVVREFEIELATGKPDWWAPLDVSRWQGKSVVVQAPEFPGAMQALETISQEDELRATEPLYHERLRPQIHFSPRRGWNNDPNGLVYADGQYHLFFQHNPYGTGWGNMHWGHAVSADLVQWKELPIALYPAKFGDWAFSGSAVVDRNNTSGWKQGTGDLIVAAYTSTGRGECMVYSNDGGLSWTEYDKNPVIKHKGRDPRLIWHAPTRQWVMALYDEHDAKKWIAFYTSPDLKTWTFQSRIDGFYECPDLFELPLNGDPRQRKWVLTAADSNYMVGTFDGRTFTPETPILKGSQGAGFYAAQTFIGDPQQRVIQMGWLRAPSPQMPFNQAMSLPLELGLVGTSTGPRLTWSPVKELVKLRTKTMSLGERDVDPAGEPIAADCGEFAEIELTVEPREATEIELQVRGIPVVYYARKHELRVGKLRVPVSLNEGKLRLRLFADRTAFEIFVGDGQTYVPVPAVPAAERRQVLLRSRGGVTRVLQYDIHRLGSIWPVQPLGASPDREAARQ